MDKKTSEGCEDSIVSESLEKQRLHTEQDLFTLLCYMAETVSTSVSTLEQSMIGSLISPLYVN